MGGYSATERNDEFSNFKTSTWISCVISESPDTSHIDGSLMERGSIEHSSTEFRCILDPTSQNSKVKRGGDDPSYQDNKHKKDDWISHDFKL